ncbi:hypothetical protein [Micromonospora maritima]|uniref:DoxX-like family protein n=1 Tax=Micromonospora maritima TaxID=986711 RepID=A0ABW7ZGY7_9ACTN
MSASSPPSFLPSEERGLPAWQIWVTFIAAALASFVASMAEMRQVGQVWLDCEMDSAGMGFGFVIFHLPVLFFGQTALVGAVATAAMAVVRPRPRAVLLAVTVGLGVLILCAFMYFTFNGLPVSNQFCRTPQPTWWP